MQRSEEGKNLRLKYPTGASFVHSHLCSAISRSSGKSPDSSQSQFSLCKKEMTFDCLLLRLKAKHLNVEARIWQVWVPLTSQGDPCLLCPSAFRDHPFCLDVRQQNDVPRCCFRKPQSSRPSISHLSQALNSFKGGKNKK